MLVCYKLCVSTYQIFLNTHIFVSTFALIANRLVLSYALCVVFNYIANMSYTSCVRAVCIYYMECQLLHYVCMTYSLSFVTLVRSLMQFWYVFCVASSAFVHHKLTDLSAVVLDASKSGCACAVGV